ncbi:MAG TPA: hypothetical protein VM368_09030, partial [Flavisolibacter sp.]|nr:hypothetical protein [Flavisolibacter sp.]
PQKGAIIKATVIVAIFKMLLSPHTPLPAYIAVFFQGFAGELIFSFFKFSRTGCVLLGILALVESAVQRIIVLVVLYGNTFWNAVNQFISKITGENAVTNYSLILAFSYIILHALAGIAAGLFAVHLVKTSSLFYTANRDYLIKENGREAMTKTKKKKRKISFLVVVWLVLILLLFQSLFNIGSPVVPSITAVQIIFRSVLIVLTWYLFISPLAEKYLKKWLQKQQAKSNKDISEVALLLPATQYLFRKSWELSARKKGLQRISTCCKIILINTLYKNA